MSDALRIALIGSGHLGGSFALALREASAPIHLTGYDCDAVQSALLRDRGGLDAIAASAADAVRDADIVMLATPLRAYRAIAEAIAAQLAPHAIVTDLGSVKHSMAALADVLPAARLVPGHPIAGGEKTGATAARGDLFRGKLCILTPNSATDAAAVASIEQLWQLAGAEVIALPVELHDAIYAHVSHVPHLIAFAAAELLYQHGVAVPSDAAALQRFLRISRSDARMWTDIALENRAALLPALATYLAVLTHFATELRAGDKALDANRALVAREHLPRILAASLISTVSLYEQRAEMSLRPFGAGGMRDMVAPIADDPEPSLAAMSNAAHALADWIDAFSAELRRVESLIGAEDAQGLFACISAMAQHAHALVEARQ